MKFIECLASYVPGLIVDQLIKDSDDHKSPVVPWRQEYETVCIFCDVSGFTALSEAMALNGKGAEGLAKHLNSYFSQMVRIIAADGGDVFKFAGDAMIVLWPESQSGDMETTVRRAAQCAVAIQENLDKSIMEEGVQLSVKIGIGFGRVSVLHVGGVYGRVEYLAVGEPLIQAFHAEHNAVSGQVICSNEVWKIIRNYFPAAATFDDGSVRIDLELKNQIQLVRKSSKMNTLRNNMSDTDPFLEGRMKAYVAGAVLPKLNRDSPEDEQWGNELRRCTVMFVNLGMKENHLLASAVYDEAMNQVHDVLMTVQKSVYQYEGSINKFLMDDKGSTLIACFGLPPVSHDDDPTRAILASLLLCEGLYDLGLIASVGITTGDVFCGVVGSKTRREYTVLGDSVNLSARLMQKACADGGGVLCDWETKNSSNGTLHFNTLDEIRVKGKSMPIKIFQPYPAGITPVTSASKGPNFYRDIHRQQLQNAIVHKSLLGFQSMFTTAGSQSLQERSRASTESFTTATVSSVSYPSPPLEAGRRQSAVLEQMRINGPITRTRRSIVRASVASASSCVITKALEGINMNPAPELPKPTNDTHRRASASSFKLNSQGPATPRSPISRTDSSGRTNSLMGKSIEIIILVPKGLLAEYSQTDSLRSIYVHEVASLDELKEKIVEFAKENPIHQSDFAGVTANDIALNIPGTRFFLPETPCSIKWLSTLYLEGKSEFPDHWKFGDPIELIICLKAEVRKIQSRLALAHRVLIEKKIALIENRRGSVIFLEGDMGIGKTDLLAKFIKRTIPNSVPIYYAPASPYSLEPFGPFSMFLQQYLDSKVFFEGANLSNRTTVLHDLLLRSGDSILYDGVLLDQYLGTHLGEVFQKQSKKHKEQEELEEIPINLVEVLSPSQKAARRLALYFYLLYMIGCQERIILIIDDAHYIDDESWALLLLLSFAINGRSQTEVAKVLGGDVQLPSIIKGISSIPSIMLIISSRPIIKHRSVFRGSCPLYDAMMSSTGLTLLKLDGLPPEETEEYLLSHLGGNVRYISEQFIQLINHKCMGNPWMMGQFVDALRSCHPPILSSNLQQNYHDSLSTAALEQLSMDEEDEPPANRESHKPFPSLASAAPGTMKNSIRKLFGSSNSIRTDSPTLQQVQIDLVENFTMEMCPLPTAVAKTFGTLLDRLNSCQQMILKTASYIGRQFTWSYLYNCYPLAGHKYRLRKELQGLLTQGYLVELPATLDSETYHFVSDFLLNLITVRMLNEQKEKIKLLVEKYQAEIEAKQRRIFAKKAMPFANSNAPLKLGFLKIQKKITNNIFTLNIKRKLQGGDWKVRYCVVSPNTSNGPANISLYRDEQHFRTSPAAPTQIIFLHEAFAQIEPEYVQHEEKFVFRVDATQYIKDKTSLEENRSFLFAGTSLQDITDWVYMIKYTIELVTDLNRLSIVRKSNPDLISSGLSLPNSSESPTDLNLEVYIHGAKDLIYPPVYNSSHCYANPVVDDNNLMKTKISFDVTNNHEFNEIFTFPLTKRQWLRTNLVVHLKTVDLFLSHDILGSVHLPLKDIPVCDTSNPEPTPTSGDQPIVSQFTETESFRLFQTGNSHQCGEVFLSFKLTLSSELEKSLEIIPSRSVDELKANIEMVLAEEDKLAELAIVYPTRITKLKELQLLLQLNETEHLSDLHSQPLPLPAPTLPREKKVTLSNTNTYSKKLSEKIHKLLRRINDDGKDVQSTPTSGAVNKMWVCSQFRDILKEFENPSQNQQLLDGDIDLRNPFKHVIEQANNLDQQHLDWLASQYTKDSVVGTADTLTARSRESSLTSLNISREESIQKKARRSSILRLEKQASISKRLSLTMSDTHSTAVFEPLVFDSSSDIDQEYYCLDDRGTKSGPFTAQTLYSWLITNQIHLQLLVSHGFKGEGEYYPLGMYERTFRRIANNSISEWPIISGTSKTEGKVSLPISMGVFADPNHIIHHYYSWDFDIWDLELHELLPLSMILLASLGLSDGFEIQLLSWRNFMDEIQEYMTKHKNPYHNYYHIADVTQTCFVFLSEMGGFELLKSYEILALVVGAIVHDLDHPGVNNLYQVNAGTPLAIEFNDISVLENHHCSLAFQVLKQSNCQIFQSLDNGTFKLVRKLMISLILATDMTGHFALKTELDELVKKKFSHENSEQQSMVLLDEKEREIILKTILHTADISNPAKLWRISKKWSDLVVEEFFNQGDREKSEGLPISPNMDRTTTFQDELSVNFTDFIVAPYFFALTAIFPKLCEPITHLATNRNIWHDMIVKRIKENSTDENISNETIAKWEKRKSVFGATFDEVKEKSQKQLQSL